MFYLAAMQDSFGFAASDLGFIRMSLIRTFGCLGEVERREPVWQLVRSLIGSQTYDEIAEDALDRLRQCWPNPADLAAATPSEVLLIIKEVNHSESKARNLVATLRWIGREHADFDLSFLQSWSVHDALNWLERFPGVADKVAAATLNASTLRMPVFIVDCHVHRILLRFGFIGERSSPRRGRDAVTAAAESWSAHELLELFVLMKRLGQKICRPFETECASCPLASRCAKKTWLGTPSKPLRLPRPNHDLVLTEPPLQLVPEA